MGRRINAVMPLKGGEIHELRPDVGLNVGADLGVDPGIDAGRVESLDAGGPAAVQFAENQLGHGPSMGDYAGRHDNGNDLCHAADDALGPEDGGQRFRRHDAVLERDDSRLRPDQGPDILRLGVVELHRHQDQVNGADGGGVVGHVGRVDVKVAVGALDTEATEPDRFQVRAPGDEMHVAPRRG